MDAQQIRGLQPMLARFLNASTTALHAKTRGHISRSMSTANSRIAP